MKEITSIFFGEQKVAGTLNTELTNMCSGDEKISSLKRSDSTMSVKFWAWGAMSV